ncbi:MAG: hypothetical protein JF616_06900 [Fibrobacteres bacterium]|nr:hypothetical protein [Fibrobacterota bacterium]
MPTAIIAALISVAAIRAFAQSADSLPAFRTDSAAADPFRKIEAGQSPLFPAKPKTDTGFRADSVTAKLTRRHPAISIWTAAEFSDLDAKEVFKADLSNLELTDSLDPLQSYEEAHLSFPIGIQAVYPLGPWFDAVAMARASWYKQTAILGHRDANHTAAGEQWYAVQSTLGGAGLRFYLPPSLLSVNGSLGLYAQLLWLWNLGGSELYTKYGSAPARIDPAGSGFELLFGLQHALKGPWLVAGSLGYVKQDYVSNRNWSDLLRSAPPAGRVSWGSSSIQASLALWYHFGVPADSATVKPAQAVLPAATVPPAVAVPPASPGKDPIPH